MEFSQQNLQGQFKFHLILFDNGEINLYSFDNFDDVKDFCIIVYKRIREDPLGEFKLFCFYGKSFKFKMNPFRLCSDDMEEIIYEEDDSNLSLLGVSLNDILKKYSSNMVDNTKLLSEEAENEDIV